MPSPAGDDERVQGGPDLITFGQMPERLEAAGLKKLSHQRCRQLAESDPNWPIPMDRAVKVGRMLLFDWNVLEPYFRGRKSRQGQRPNVPKETPPNDASEQPDQGDAE